jgi:hypothetical protein
MKTKTLVLEIVCPLCVTSAYAYDFAVANADGVTIYYNKSGSNASVTYKSEEYYSAVYSYSGNVVIPSRVIYSGATYNVTSIGNGAFSGCSSLIGIHSKKPTPSRLDFSLPNNTKSNAFDNVDKTSCTLYVTKGSKSAYQAATEWKEFTHIIEVEDGNAIASATIDDSPVLSAEYKRVTVYVARFWLM